MIALNNNFHRTFSPDNSDIGLKLKFLTYVGCSWIVKRYSSLFLSFIKTAPLLIYTCAMSKVHAVKKCMIFTFTAGKMVITNGHQSTITKSNTSRGSYLDLKLFIFLPKYLNSLSWPSPFKLVSRNLSFFSPRWNN